jgi:hypothetical protein
MKNEKTGGRKKGTCNRAVEGRLTPKQERFVSEYLKDLNGAAAAVRTGYSLRTADRQAYALLRKPEISRVWRRLRSSAWRRTRSLPRA